MKSPFTPEVLSAIQPLTWITVDFELAGEQERVLLTSKIKFRKGNEEGVFSYYSAEEKQCFQNQGSSSWIVSFDPAPATK